jgi:hypothetical protein
MGRDTWRYRQHEKERAAQKRTHPIWRGVGCLVILALTVGGYFLAEWFLTENARQGWIPIPTGLVVVPFAPWLPAGLVLKALVAIVFMVLSYGIVSVLYSVLFPIRPGEYDVPPLKRRPRRRK